MTKLYITKNDSVYDKLKTLLSQYIPHPIEFLRTPSGKPYVSGNPVYFNLSHKGDTAAIAISNLPVGVDVELPQGKQHSPVIARFSLDEQKEITCEKDFLRHWTAREAFVKMNGFTLSESLKKLSFVGGEIYFENIKQPCDITFFDVAGGVVAICTHKVTPSGSQEIEVFENFFK